MFYTRVEMPAAIANTIAALAAIPGKGTFGVKLQRGTRLELPRHADSPDPLDLAAVRSWVARQTGPTAIDIFAGAGGLSLGLTDAGFNVLVGADSDLQATETHAANIGGLTYRGDLSDPDDFLCHLNAWGIDKVDLVAGGVPCQPFSNAGRSVIRSLVRQQRRPEHDERADLWQSFLQVVRAIKPRAVLLENVPDLATWDEGAVLVGFCEGLRDLGYWTDARVINAHEHGVPQHRSRLFIVGLKAAESFPWPEPRHGRRPTVEAAIGDMPVIAGGQREESLPYDRPRSELQKRLRRGVARRNSHVIHDHISRAVRPDDALAFAALEQGGTYAQVPEELRRYRSDTFRDKYNRLAWKSLSRSITAHIAKDGYWYIHPSQNRTLTIREAARIQTFPDWFRFAGEPSHRYRQIGNAVPPLLAEAIGQSLIESLSRTGRPRRRENRSTMRGDLVAWHMEHSRDYPWRKTKDPWLVLLAEMCLHRTRADQVEPVFRELARLGPTPAELLANRVEVERAIQPLGLRWRLANLSNVAKVLLDKHQGAVPNDRQGLLSLPGVGDYVASAVLVFGFGRRTVLMDTNTERIISRVRGHQGGTRAWQRRLDLYRVAGHEGADSAFNYALLDLGAAVCRARKPLCTECPIRSHCVMGGSTRISPDS